MKQPISVFIMDVSNSTAENNWDELTAYLKVWEKTIGIWCKGVIPAKTKHRLGDEILFVGHHFFSAYMVAFYIDLHWKMENQRPYFGLAFDTIEGSIHDIDIEIWNHPVIKRARQANEKIKENKTRDTTISFSLVEPTYDVDLLQGNEEILNLLNEHQELLLKNQTQMQQLICSLYSVFNEQRQIGKVIGKSPGTISSHYKKGNCDLIFKTFGALQRQLGLWEVKFEESQSNVSRLPIHPLNDSIRTEISRNISRYYPALKL